MIQAGATVIVAIISDTHLPRGARQLPDGCRRRLAEAELILHAGDFTSSEVLEQLRALGPPVAAVAGNVDEPALAAQLPRRRVVDAGGVRIGLIHDAGPAARRLERLGRCFPQAQAVVFGHSHMPLLERAADGFQIFNPGSPTQRRRAPAHTMGLGRTTAAGIQFELVALD